MYRVANTFWKRFRGAIGYGRNFQPLLIPNCRSLHTFWMKGTIDCFWIDTKQRVIKIHRSVPPRRIIHCMEASGVLEVPAQKLKMKIGDNINHIPKNSLDFSADESGSVITEFALILPILLLLIFGFLQLSLVLSDKLKLTHAVNYATFVGAATNDNTKITGALGEYYSLADITYQVQSFSAQTGNLINDTSRRHNDVVQLAVRQPANFSIPFMSVFNIELEAKASARVLCTNTLSPYTCD